MEHRAPDPSVYTLIAQGPSAVETQPRLSGMEDQRRGGGGGGEPLEAEQGFKPISYSLCTGFVLAARGVFNNASSFHWREGHSWDMCGHLLYQAHCTVEGGGGEVEPLTFPAGSPCSPSPPSAVGTATSGLAPIAQDPSWPTVATVPQGVLPVSGTLASEL